MGARVLSVRPISAFKALFQTSKNLAMNLREWLIVAGVVIILGILIDGIRRMRLARQDSLKMSRDLGGQIESSPLDDDFNPELPSGSARVVATGVDSVNEESHVSGISAIDDDFEVGDVEPSLGLDLVDNQDFGDISAKQKPVSKKVKASKSAAAKVAKSPEKKGENKPRQSDKTAAQETPDHEVIVINVDARTGQVFSGAAIKKLLEACGMQHGDMSIFHRHEEDLLSPIQFSVANAVEPGYFDPDKLDSLTTPGVSFFMSIPGPKDYLKAFEFMYETAKCFADNLQGELKDENRSVLTSQTIEHSKQRIREFERKQLCKARP